MPAILGLKHLPVPNRQRQKRIAEAFAKGCRQACDRTSENGARLLLEILGFVLPLDFRELTLRRHLVGRRSQVKSDTLLLVEPPVIVRTTRTQLIFRRLWNADLVEDQQLQFGGD